MIDIIQYHNTEDIVPHFMYMDTNEPVVNENGLITVRPESTHILMVAVGEKLQNEYDLTVNLEGIIVEVIDQHAKPFAHHRYPELTYVAAKNAIAQATHRGVGNVLICSQQIKDTLPYSAIVNTKMFVYDTPFVYVGFSGPIPVDKAFAVVRGQEKYSVYVNKNISKYWLKITP